MSTFNGFKRRITAATRALKGEYVVLDDGEAKAVMSKSQMPKGTKVVTLVPKNAPPAAQSKKPSDSDNEVKIVIDDSCATIEALNPSYCCGCGACFNTCPVDAIKMTKDEEGFFAPVIDHDKCINCGKCRKACPVMSAKYTNNPDPACYAVMADTKIRKQSSSGGMFSLIANYFFSQGGYVCGVVLNDEFLPEHIVTNNPDDLKRMQGSKYVQSNTGKCFTQVKALLDKGEKVLFTGTPCQAAGLKGFLNKDYDNLLIVDLVCHGAPSQKIFSKYLDVTYGKENLEDFKFRTKEFGYSSFYQTAYMKDGSTVSTSFRFDSYEKIMHSGLALKPVCGDCMFAPAPRQGDISIGDFWGVSKYNAEYNDHVGTSCVLINNKKGEKIFDIIKKDAIMVETVPFDHAKRNNRFGRKMRTPESGRKWFYSLLDYQPLDKLVDYSLNRKFDIGVIGLWYGRNYGSMATYYALHQVLKNKFHLSVLMIENPLKPNDEKAPTKTHPRKIANEFYDVSKQYKLSEMKNLNAFCDTFIVGSDQLWNIGLSRPYGQTYFLEFVNEKNKKISYGTSFGKEYNGSSADKLLSSHNLRRFDHVSVRDKLSKSIAENEFGVENVTEVCDPTFLCPLDEYQKLIDRATVSESEEYILAYILDPNENIGRELEQLSVDKNRKVIVMLDEVPWIWEKNVEKLGLKGNGNVEVKKEVDLYEWMWYYSHSSAVVTDSFHGTIFSIIFEKPFITMVNVKRGAQRFVSLLEPLNLKDRLFDGPEAIGEHKDMLDALDYTVPNKKLDEIRRESMKWLEDALFSKKEVNDSAIYPSIDKRLVEK